MLYSNINFLVLGHEAEVLAENLREDAEIEVTGQIYTYSWKPQGTEQRLQRTEILANRVNVTKMVYPEAPRVREDLPF